MVGPCSTNPELRPRRSGGETARPGRENIYIGGSSWKYEGWLGQVYSRGRYLARGRFSRSAFETECLREYAETFPTVCGDFTFYQFPSRGFLAQTVRRARHRVSVSHSKCRSRSPARCSRRTPRYGSQAGRENEASWTRACCRRCFCARCCRTRRRRRC